MLLTVLTFHWLCLLQYTEIAISATFKSTATQPDEVYQHYGEDLGQITGPYTRIDYESAQVLEYMAQVLVSHEPIEGEFVVLESEREPLNQGYIMA